MFASVRVWLVAFLILGAIFAFPAIDCRRKYQLAGLAASSIFLAFLILGVLAVMPGVAPSESRRAGWQLWLWPAAPCIPYLIYAAGTGDFRWIAMAKLAAIPTAMLLLYRAVRIDDEATFYWQDFFAGVLLIAVVLSGFLRGIWRLPVNLDFLNRLLLIAVAGWTWTLLRPVPELGYSLRLSRSILFQALMNFVLFAVIGIPLSLALGFTRWSPRWPGLPEFLMRYIEIFCFISLLEEMFFRGFLQSLLTKTWRNWVAAQIFVSCLFGLFHILHAPFPNWRYVLLASIAGWFYGSAFRKTGNLTTAALVHAALDTTWRTWFSAR